MLPVLFNIWITKPLVMALGVGKITVKLPPAITIASSIWLVEVTEAAAAKSYKATVPADVSENL